MWGRNVCWSVGTVGGGKSASTVASRRRIRRHVVELDALIADAPDRGKASSVYWGRWLSLNEAKRVRTLLVARLRELGLLPQ